MRRRSQFIFLFCLFVFVIVYCHIIRAARNPRYGRLFYTLGLQCQNECSLNKRLRYFEKAVFYDPNLSDAYYHLGIIYGEKRWHEKEIESYRKVTRLDHANSDAYFKMGQYYFQTGEFEYALRYFLESYRYNPALKDAFYYVAKAYDRKGMYKEAVHYYVTLIIWYSPHSAEACERIRSIARISGQHEMVLNQVQMIQSSGELNLWEQVEQYIQTGQVPQFMQKSMK